MNTRAPDTLQPADTWRTHGLCRTHPEPDTWFPTGGAADALADRREAKTLCGACPVMRTCLAWSLAIREPHGIWGGIDETKRRSLLRRHPNGTVPHLVTIALRQPTLRDIYTQRTEQHENGHATWTRTTTVIKVDGRDYTPKQLAFRVGRGRAPEGVVTSECGVPDCYALGHLADARMRRDHRAWLDDEEAA